MSELEDDIKNNRGIGGVLFRSFVVRQCAKYQFLELNEPSIHLTSNLYKDIHPRTFSQYLDQINEITMC